MTAPIILDMSLYRNLCDLKHHVRLSFTFRMNSIYMYVYVCVLGALSKQQFALISNILTPLNHTSLRVNMLNFCLWSRGLYMLI